MGIFNFDKIYVLAINHSQEKYDDIQRRLGQLGLASTVSYEIINGHNGQVDELPDGFAAYENWAIPNSWNDWWKDPVTPGGMGCAISHINVWQKMIDEGVERALILEEDFYAVKPLRDLKEPENTNFDWAMLGRYVFDEQENKTISDQWVYPGLSYCTHAYVLTNRGAHRLLNDFNYRQNIIPLDEFTTATYMTHRRDDIENLFPNKSMTFISTSTDWIGQSSTAETSTIGHSSKNVNNDTNMEQNTIQEPKEKYFEILDTSDWDAWKAKYLNHTLSKGEYDLMLDDLGDNVYEFQLFTEKFCREAVALAEELDNWTIDRHEFYPTNDVLLQDIGLQDIYHRVLKEVVYPLCIHIWTLEGKDWLDMYSENFLARYTTDRQSHLSLHHDFSHVTMVVKLNDEFEGGGTWFPKYNLLSNPKRIGTATLHPGMVTHLHGARPIYSGKRYICVSFMRKEK